MLYVYKVYTVQHIPRCVAKLKQGYDLQLLYTVLHTAVCCYKIPTHKSSSVGRAVCV